MARKIFNVLGEELKSFFIESDQNYLALEEYNIKSAHKYGSYANYYHDYGIIYDNSPYIVVILTTFGKDDYKSIIQDISKHIYELHKTYEKEHAEICYNKIYKE